MLSEVRIVYLNTKLNIEHIKFLLECRFLLRKYSLTWIGFLTFNILQQGDTGIPGEWIFEISGTRIQRCKPGVKGDTCDEGTKITILLSKTFNLVCGSDEWGADCAGCCHCAQGASCHNVTGECPAQVGCSDCWIGDTCQQRKHNVFIIF